MWKHEEDKRLNEHFKKHPEDVGTLHITENSMTFDFSKKKKIIMIKLEKIKYLRLSPRQQENYNYTKVASGSCRIWISNY